MSLTYLQNLALNVPAVNDVFLRPIRKNAKRFYGRKKMWRSNTPQRGVAPTGVLRSPSRRQAAKRLPTCYAK